MGSGVVELKVEGPPGNGKTLDVSAEKTSSCHVASPTVSASADELTKPNKPKDNETACSAARAEKNMVASLFAYFQSHVASFGKTIRIVDPPHPEVVSASV
jgi:hypothetical protein